MVCLDETRLYLPDFWGKFQPRPCQEEDWWTTTSNPEQDEALWALLGHSGFPSIPFSSSTSWKTAVFCSLQHSGHLALGSGLILPSLKLNPHLLRGAKASNMSISLNLRWFFNRCRPLHILCAYMHAWIHLNMIFLCMLLSYSNTMDLTFMKLCFWKFILNFFFLIELWWCFFESHKSFMHDKCGESWKSGDVISGDF